MSPKGNAFYKNGTSTLSWYKTLRQNISTDDKVKISDKAVLP